MEDYRGFAVVLKRFIKAFFAFVGLVIPAAFLVALLAAPAARPEPVQPGCDRNLANATAGLAAMQARLKGLGTGGGPEMCNVTRLYFLELVKARAVVALCKNGPERERDLGRFDADVEHTNEAIAARCG
jgi:hypothetical protein